MEFPELCDRVLAIDSTIRYAAVLSRDGRRIAGGMRSGMDSMEPKRVSEEMDFQTSHYYSSLERWEKHFGTLNFTFVNYQKVLVFFVPLGAYLLNVTAEPSFKLERIQEIIALANSARNAAATGP